MCTSVERKENVPVIMKMGGTLAEDRFSEPWMRASGSVLLSSLSKGRKAGIEKAPGNSAPPGWEGEDLQFTYAASPRFSL